jgi:hypothetical protein
LTGEQPEPHAPVELMLRVLGIECESLDRPRYTRHLGEVPGTVVPVGTLGLAKPPPPVRYPALVEGGRRLKEDNGIVVVGERAAKEVCCVPAQLARRNLVVAVDVVPVGADAFKFRSEMP